MSKLFWIVKFSVDKTWVADGFDLTDERALDMLSNDLRYANIGGELKAKVLKAPKKKVIRTLQGY